MLRNLLILATAIAAASAVAPAHAGDVYQWKDASGVTHFTQTPPPNGSYVHRVIQENGNGESSATINDKPVATAAAAPAGPAQSSQCERARQNIATLEGKAPVTMDSDGDGKPDKTLSDDDRANQLALAQATVKANCGS